MDVNWIWYYYNQGFSIIPLGQNKRYWGNKENELKRPSLKTWDKYKDTRATKEEIQTWIDQGLFKNIGIVCGHVSNDLVIIDIDDESIPELINIKLDKILETGAWIVKTGKGYQIYMKHHGNPGDLKRPIKYKIEYRSNNGYCVAPPSIHPNGKQYKFLYVKDYTELPSLQIKDAKSIFEEFKTKIGEKWGIKKTVHNHHSQQHNKHEQIKGYPKCVEIALNQITKHPMRYYTIYGLASAFYFNKIPIDMAMKRIKEFNMKKCVPPHQNSIVENAVTNAYQPGAKRYGCEFWMDQAELCPYENITDCPHGNKKTKRELAKKYHVFKYKEEKNEVTQETYHIKNGVICPNLAELILNEYDYNFVTLDDTKEIYYYNGGMYHQKGDTIIRTISEDYMEELTSKHRKNEVEDYIRDKNYINRNKFNAPKHLINLKNGIYNLRTKKLISHNPKYKFINEIPVKYDENAECPKIKKFISEVVEEKHVACIQEFIGYCLYRDIPFHKAFMFLGGGKNGKSTVINLITTFLGRENISNKELQQLTYDKFAKSKLFGKLINAAADISSAALGQTSTFKGLTGGDYLDAEKKFLDSFEFKNYAKMLFSANTLPKTKDDSYAFYRRWILINFPYTFEGKECDPHILEKICTPKELSGLFNWAIEGLLRLLKNNHFSYQKTVEEIREQYKILSDPVFAFAQQFLTTQTTGYLIKDDVYHKFNAWCKENDLPVTPKNMFSQDLQKNVPNVKPGRSRINGKLTQVYNYISWKDDVVIDDKNDEIEKIEGNPEQQLFSR